MIKKITLILLITISSFNLYSQIRVQADFGVSTATGDFGKDASLGIGYAVNARWMFTEQIEAGLEYDGSAIFSVSGDGGGDIDATGMTGYLAKGYYSFFDGDYTPYVAFGLGLYKVETPTITYTDGNGNTTTYEGESDINFGFTPEVGVMLKNFIIGAKFSYAGKAPAQEDINATYARFFIGYKLDFDGIR